jgi:pimeloyl-ACP methyl ester carboxylesterase
VTRRRAWVAAVAVALLAVGTAVSSRFYAGRVEATVHALRRVPATRIAFCRCAPDSAVRLVRDGLSLAADLYGLDGSRRPAVLLLHGLTPDGNDLPLYHVLASRLADEGFFVLALDFAGYGDSDDPYALGTEAALDTRRDVRAALDLLGVLPAASEGVTLLGHSMGAIEAMQVGLADPRVGTVVALGPPRRTAEVLATEEGRGYHWNRIRRTYDSVYHRPMPAWFTRERFLALKAQRDIELFREAWAAAGHVPLLLVDGEREAPEDREYLRGYATRVQPPSRYVTIDEADHYLNSGRIGELIYYDRAAVGAFVTELRDWVASEASGPGR